jgi:hypothetical protein
VSIQIGLFIITPSLFLGIIGVGAALPFPSIATPFIQLRKKRLASNGSCAGAVLNFQWDGGNPAEVLARRQKFTPPAEVQWLTLNMESCRTLRLIAALLKYFGGRSAVLAHWN